MTTVTRFTQNSKIWTDSVIGIHQALWKLSVPITRDTITAWGPNKFLIQEKQKAT